MAIEPSSIEVLVRLSGRTCDDMFDLRTSVVGERALDRIPLDLVSDHLELRDVDDLAQVVDDGLVNRMRLEVTLEEFILEFLEERALVVAKLRVEPVLRVEKDLPVRLPYPVSAHGLPLFGVFGRQGKFGLESEEASLHEELDGAQRLPNSRSGGAGAHFDVEEEVVEEIGVGFETGLMMGDQPG